MVWQLLVLAGLLTVTLGCSPPEGVYEAPTLDWKVKKSQVVAHGLVLSSVPDTRFPADDVYSVQMELRCIYKGVPERQIITIDEVGHISGHCDTTELIVGNKYLVYLKESESGRYRQAFVQDPGHGDYLEEIKFLCETKVSYPVGRNKTHNNEVCPEKEQVEDCVPIPMATSSSPLRPEEDTSLVPDMSEGQQPASPGGTEPNVPYKPVYGQEVTENNQNGSGVLTWHISFLTCLVLFVLMQ